MSLTKSDNSKSDNSKPENSKQVEQNMIGAGVPVRIYKEYSKLTKNSSSFYWNLVESGTISVSFSISSESSS